MSDQSRPTLSAFRAVALGHLAVSLPSILIGVTLMVVVGLLLHVVIHVDAPKSVLLSGLAALPATWLYWSVAIPRWRDWVVGHSCDVNAIQRLGVMTGLLWPKGSLPERTEFRRRNGRRGWDS